MLSLLRKLYRCESGATAVEYGLIAALISVVIISALQLASTSMIDAFNFISTSIRTALST